MGLMAIMAHTKYGQNKLDAQFDLMQISEMYDRKLDEIADLEQLITQNDTAIADLKNKRRESYSKQMQLMQTPFFNSKGANNNAIAQESLSITKSLPLINKIMEEKEAVKRQLNGQRRLLHAQDRALKRQKSIAENRAKLAEANEQSFGKMADKGIKDMAPKV